MPPSLIPRIPPRLTPLLLLTTGTALLFYRHYQLPYPMKATTTIPNSLQQSPRYHRQINPSPKQSQAVDSTHSMTIPRPRDPRTGRYISDTEVLRRFTLGLWSGWAFTVERTLLVWVAPRRLQVGLGLEVVGPEENGGRMRVEEALCERVQTIDDLRRTLAPPAEPLEPSESTTAAAAAAALPKPGTVLFGAFKVAGVQIAKIQRQPSAPSSSPSAEPGGYIDFIYGAHTSWIRGMHRFEVISSPKQSDVSPSSEAPAATSEAESITIRFSSSSLRPPPPSSSREGADAGAEKPLVLGGRIFGPALTYFHNIYAGYLFADGMREVLRG
jgi:hypothetical protein